MTVSRVFVKFTVVGKRSQVPQCKKKIEDVIRCVFEVQRLLLLTSPVTKSLTEQKREKLILGLKGASARGKVEQVVYKRRYLG